jgi:putative PIN family toxin of toxin-antitoxin system
MRVVLDANVLVSAAISQGSSHRIVQAWLTSEPFEPVVCQRLLDEVDHVLTKRPRLRRWITVPAAELYLTRVATAAEIQPDPEPAPRLSRDPDDDYVIYLARGNEVVIIVTGDDDLLEWSEQDPPTMSPSEFETRIS